MEKKKLISKKRENNRTDFFKNLKAGSKQEKKGKASHVMSKVIIQSQTQKKKF